MRRTPTSREVKPLLHSPRQRSSGTKSMSHPRPLDGHSIRREVVTGRPFVWLVVTAERMLHPRRSLRSVIARLSRRPYPSIIPMSEDEFAVYAKRTGIEAQLVKTVSKAGGPLEDQAGTDGRLQGTTQGSES